MRQKHPLADQAQRLRRFYPDLYAQFRPRTWRDVVREFIFDLRANPRLALICTFAGLALGFAASFGVAEIIIWVTR